MSFQRACLLLLLAAPAAAGARLDLDRESVAFDGQFTARLTLPSNCFMGEFPESPQYKVVSDRTETVQKLGKVSIDQFSSKVQHSAAGFDQVRLFVLRPLTGGVITIEPIAVRCAGGTDKTFRRTIHVIGAPPQRAQVPAEGARPKQKEEADPLGGTVGIQDLSNAKQGKTVANSAIESPVVVSNPVAPVLPKTPLAEAEEMDRQFSSQYLRFKSAVSRRLTPGMRQALRFGIIALFAAAALAFLFPWKRLKDWWSAQGKKAFARKPALPSINIRRETDLIGGKYKLEDEIGSGGMGMVFRAQDRKLSRVVAVKKLRAELQFSPEERANFIREAMMISRLSHPFIVAIHEIIEQDGDIYMILDYVDGKPLSALIDAKKGLGLKVCKDLFSNVCQAVDFAHKKNVLHQDLKPSNIMVDVGGFAKVMDFGLARDAKTASDEILGTLAYMAPEMHLGVGTAASDIYSLGVCLYEALGGRIPFPGPRFQQQKERMDYVAITKLRPELPKTVDAFFAAALAPNPKDRIPGAMEFLDRLSKL